MNFEINNNVVINSMLAFVAFGILIASGSLYRYAFNYNILMAVVILMIGLILFYQFFLPRDHSLTDTSIPNVNFNLSGLIMMLFFLFIPILIDIVNLVPSYEITYFHIVMLSLVLLLGKELREKIFKYYLHIIVGLSLISIVFFFIDIFFQIPSAIPSLVTKNNTSLFYFVWSQPFVDTFFIRNQSIFWEPGAFGFHLTVAFILAYKYKIKSIYMVILTIAALTTLSTTVYAILSLLILYNLVYGRNKLNLIILIGVLMSIFLVGIKIFLGNFNLLFTVTEAIIDKFDQRTAAYASLNERTIFFKESINLFWDNMILGAGHYSTHSKLPHVQSQSSALAGLLAELGIIGVFCILLYVRFFKYFKIFSIPITLLWLNGEFMQYTALGLFILGHMIDEYAQKLFPDLTISKNYTKVNTNITLQNSDKIA